MKALENRLSRLERDRERKDCLPFVAYQYGQDIYRVGEETLSADEFIAYCAPWHERGLPVLIVELTGEEAEMATLRIADGPGAIGDDIPRYNLPCFVAGRGCIKGPALSPEKWEAQSIAVHNAQESAPFIDSKQ